MFERASGVTRIPAIRAAIDSVSRHAPYIVKFGLVGLTGLIINTLALIGFAEGMGVHYLLAVALATQVSTLWNFGLTERLVFGGSKDGRLWRLVGFAALNNLALLVRGPIVFFLTETWSIHYVVSNVITLLGLMMIRYFVSAGWLWRGNGAPLAQADSVKGVTPAIFQQVGRGAKRVVARLTPQSERTRRMLGPLTASWWWQNRVAAAVVVSVAAIVLRFWSLNALGLNSDEAVYTGQGASLAGIAPFNENFSVFRAHPLLFQYSVAALFQIHFWDTAGRWVAAIFGVATLWVTFRIAEMTISRKGAWIATAFLAVMPYHVIVSRQALLEAPMTFFMALTMYALIRYQRNPTLVGALGIGAAAGLAVLGKETAGIILLSLGLFVALRGSWNLRHVLGGAAVFTATVSPHLFATIAGRTAAGEGGAGWANYLLWQLSRPPNHPDSFYIGNMPHYFGVPMLLLLLAGIVWLVAKEGRSTDRSVLLLTWIGVPLLVFQLWPVKGYHYLLPIAPAVAVVAVVGLGAIATWLKGRNLPERLKAGAGPWLVVLSIVTAIVISAFNGPIFLNHDRIGDAGYSGLPGIRGLITWIDDETPEGARFLGIGPSITNVIAFYTDRETLALSVSPNPVRRNPAYEAVRNADYDVRWGLYEYLVYDTYSAERTSHFANRLLDLADRYASEIVYEREGTLVQGGDTFTGALFRVYEVAPINSGIELDPEE